MVKEVVFDELQHYFQRHPKWLEQGRSEEMNENFVDGDGSPVKETVIEVAEKALDVVIVTSVDHYSLKDYPENVSFVYVDKGADAADFKIVQLIKKGSFNYTRLWLSFLGFAKRSVSFTSTRLSIYERKY